MYRFIGSIAALKYAVSALPFLILPFISRVLTTEEFSLYLLANVFMTIAQPFISFNIQTGQRLHSLQNPGSELANCFSAISFMLFTSVMVLVIVWLLPSNRIVGDFVDIKYLIVFAAVSFSIFASIDSYYVSLLKTKPIIFFSLGSAALVWLMVVVFTHKYESGTARILSQGLIYTLIILMWLGFKHAKSNQVETLVILANIKEMLSISLPLMPMVVAELAILHVDKLAVVTFLSPADQNIYLSFFQLAIMGLFFTKAINSGFEAMIFKNSDRLSLASLPRKIIYLVCLISLGLFSFQKYGASFFLNISINVFDPILSILIVGFFLKALIVVFMPMYIANGSQVIVLRGYIINLIFYLPLLYFGGTYLGGVGIALAMLMSQLFMVLYLSSSARGLLKLHENQ